MKDDNLAKVIENGTINYNTKKNFVCSYMSYEKTKTN